MGDTPPPTSSTPLAPPTPTADATDASIHGNTTSSSATSSDSEMLTSFSNPNYELNDADALNSNLPASQYYSNSGAVPYSNHDPIPDNATTTAEGGGSRGNQAGSEDGTSTTSDVDNMPPQQQETGGGGSTKRRKKYAQMDLSDALGVPAVAGGGGVVSSSGEHSRSSSVDDLCGDDSTGGVPAEDGENVMDSGALVELRHSASEDHPEGAGGDDDVSSGAGSKRGSTAGGTGRGGFLGYYASLEMSVQKTQQQDEEAQKQEEQEDEREGEQQQQEKGEEGKQEQAAAAAAGNVQRYEGKPTDINSPDSNDSGIQADESHSRSAAAAAAAVPDDAAPAGSRRRSSNEQQAQAAAKQEEQEEGDTCEQAEIPLPPGWQKCADEDGAYYWHIKSGSIQRDVPTMSSAVSSVSINRSLSTSSQSSQRDRSGDELDHHDHHPHHPPAPPPAATGTRDPLSEFQGHALKYATASLKSMSLSDTPHAASSPPGGGSTPHSDAVDGSTSSHSGGGGGPYAQPPPIRFAVRSLGWVRIAEEDLTPERSSRAVNKCIVDLSLGRNDINDVVGRWGDGKDLYMDLDHDNLTLIDPQDMTVLNMQSIQSIRVWGVGRDNGRDFAYVARDRSSRRHMCHVFRCDTPARHIANKLRDICKQIMFERSLAQQQQQQQQQQVVAGGSNGVSNGAARPNNLGLNLEKTIEEKIAMRASFPTPMEEPKKTLRCHYLGTSVVSKPTGVEVLNGAIEKVYASVPPEKWVFVSMAVAPSTITITEHADPDNVLAECRMRFLSFMGIAMRNIKLFGFIVHTAQGQFIAHVFHCEPSVGAICKTIQAACMLRYQKCLDSHATSSAPSAAATSPNSQQPEQSTSRGIGSSIKSVFSRNKHRKSKS